MIIGIIGAQGNFGSKLEERIRNIKTPEIDVLATQNREDSRSVAEKSDVLILTIPQSRVANLFEEIEPFLKKDAIIISFIGHFPILRIKEITKRSAVRAIADPWFNFSAFIKDGIGIPSSLDFLFKNLTKNKPHDFKKDTEIDLFTIYFCYLFVVLFLSKQEILISVDNHLEEIGSVLFVPKDELVKYLPDGDSKELLAFLATKGGITEMIHSLFLSNINISPKEIVEEVSKKFI